MSTDFRKIARSKVGDLIPHTTSVHNVTVLAGALRDAYCAGMVRVLQGLKDTAFDKSTVHNYFMDIVEELREEEFHT